MAQFPTIRIGAQSSIEIHDGLETEITEGGSVRGQSLWTGPLYTVTLILPYACESQVDEVEDFYTLYRLTAFDVDLTALDRHIYSMRFGKPGQRGARPQIQKHDNAPRRWQITCNLIGSRIL